MTPTEQGFELPFEPSEAAQPEMPDPPGVHPIHEPKVPEELFELLHERERERLGSQIVFDYDAALIGHTMRMRRFARYYQLWRNIADPPDIEDDAQQTRFRVPMVQSDTFAKWAQNLDALFGDDAEVQAEPVGPSDLGTARKVGTFLDWRVFSDMKLVNPFAIFEHRKLLYGRAFAYAPWEVKSYYVNDRDPATKVRTRREVKYYEGPGFYPLLPDDILVPAERVQNIQEFSYVIRKFKATPQDLLDGEAAGLYFGISEHWEKIINWAMVARQTDVRGDEIKLEEQFLDEVNYDATAASGESTRRLTVHEWYGYWRLPKLLGADVELTEHKRRERMQTHLRVYYIPDLQLVIGVDDLADLYPKTAKRRPFVEASCVKDGSYWCMGFGEMLESLEDESSHVHRIFMKAGEMSAGPLILARPSAGFKRDQSVYKPFSVLFSEDPGGVNQLQFKADHNWSIAMSQDLLNWKERKDGLTDSNVGRSSDRPNAPRTASGQLALIEQGNIRASIDTTTLREDFSAILDWFWELEGMFGSADTFFRVTEEDAQGLFDVAQGGAKLTEAERNGRFDFRIKFASSYWSREAKKERFLQLYQLLLGNPLIATNAIVLGQVTRELCKQLGHPDIAALIPMPAQIDAPRTPGDEWTLMLEGRDAPVNPQDNDEMHMVEHQRQLQVALQAPEPDQDAIMRLQDHMAKTEIQIQQKLQMQAMANAVVQQAAAAGQMATQGGDGNGPGFGGASANKPGAGPQAHE